MTTFCSKCWCSGGVWEKGIKKCFKVLRFLNRNFLQSKEIFHQPITSLKILPQTKRFNSCIFRFYSPPMRFIKLFLCSLLVRRWEKKLRTVAARKIAMLSRLISSKAGNFSSPKVFYHLLSFSIRLSFALFAPRRADWEDAIKFMNASYQPTKVEKIFRLCVPGCS